MLTRQDMTKLQHLFALNHSTELHHLQTTADSGQILVPRQKYKVLHQRNGSEMDIWLCVSHSRHIDLALQPLSALDLTLFNVDLTKIGSSWSAFLNPQQDRKTAGQSESRAHWHWSSPRDPSDSPSIWQARIWL